MAKNTNSGKFFKLSLANLRGGKTAKGDDYRKFGAVIQSGPEKGKYADYFKVRNENTAPYYRKDCKVMGVTNDDPGDFQHDGRVFTGYCEQEEYNGRLSWKVLSVMAYDASKYAKEDQEDQRGEELPF
jgi:hypothetical protein